MNSDYDLVTQQVKTARDFLYRYKMGQVSQIPPFILSTIDCLLRDYESLVYHKEFVL